jgi:two-component system NarL family response regulator
MIKVLLVEDDEVFRLGLTVSLKQSKSIHLVGTAADGEAAIVQAEKLCPDLILMDIGLPVLNGIQATLTIKTHHPQIKILVLTSHSDPKLVEQIMGAGADGFCLKGVSTERLLGVIQEVYQGAFWVDEAVAAQIKKFFQGTSALGKPVELSAQALKLLTDREQEVLALIADGKKNLEIADVLCISPGTVRVHVHSILSKLNVRDRTQAALLATQKPDGSDPGESLL